MGKILLRCDVCGQFHVWVCGRRPAVGQAPLVLQVLEIAPGGSRINIARREKAHRSAQSPEEAA